jgi:hypothetical protein
MEARSSNDGGCGITSVGEKLLNMLTRWWLVEARKSIQTFDEVKN